MDRWAGHLYGDPCRECTFAFSTSLDESIAYIAGVPRTFSELLVHAHGTERHPDLEWSVGSYVCHVGDNLRIWAERLAGSASGAKAVTAYDENLLAEARSYTDVPLKAALWSLDRACEDWRLAVAQVPREGVVVIHRERGEMHLEDVARGNAHDAFHHAWDIRRSLDGGQLG
jgi:DinB superfamily